MTLTKLFTGRKATKPLLLLFLVFAVLLLPGCGHHPRTAKFASHKVTLDRSGITNRFGVEERGKLAIFHYDGFAVNAGRLKVTIENEKVSINDKVVGMLKEGDEVYIKAEGLRVNSLDYGQTEKYLQDNLKQFVTQNLER